MGKKAVEHTALLVLSLLSTEDMYGYQMISRLEQKFDSTFSMQEGTLYPVLRKLENQGAVRSYEKQAPSGRIRKYYHLTASGKLLLRQEARQWEAYQQGVSSVVKLAVLD